MGFREAYQNASEAESRAHGAMNIRSTFQFQNHALPRFFDFAVPERKRGDNPLRAALRMAASA